MTPYGYRSAMLTNGLYNPSMCNFVANGMVAILRLGGAYGSSSRARPWGRYPPSQPADTGSPPNRQAPVTSLAPGNGNKKANMTEYRRYWEGGGGKTADMAEMYPGELCRGEMTHDRHGR